MAYLPKRLKETGFISDSATAMYANPSGKKTIVKFIMLHNTHSGAVTVEIWNVPDDAGSEGVAADSNRIYNLNLIANQTVQLPHETSAIMLIDTNDTIQAKASVADKVTITMSGVEE